jgi:putative tricarboxylic transport membrane protein
MAAPRERLPGELVFAGLMLLLSAFLLWTAHGISGFKSLTSAGSFPMAAAATMLLCSLVVAVQSVKARPADAASAESLPRRFLRRIAPPVLLWSTLAIVIYMLTLEWLGFIVGSSAFLLVTMFILGERRWLRMLLVSALSLAAIYVVFQTAFSVVLPTGSLWQGVFQ